MDLTWLKENAKVARRHCEGWTNTIKYLWLLYSNLGPLHRLTGNREFRLAFKFADPIGRIRLKLRNNKGADSFIFSELFLHNYYDLRLPGVPRNILDLGANIGLTAIFWNRTYPQTKLACVEPMPNNLEVLKWNIAENKVDITVLEGAVAVADGEIRMEIAEKDFGHQVATETSTGKETIKVNAYSMPTILNRLGWSEIDLLKVDIEGYEAYLLKENRDWLRQVNHMIIELHGTYPVEELNGLARDFGFTKPEEIYGLWHLRRIQG
jgi:FkbM family methyltransferase